MRLLTLLAVLVFSSPLSAQLLPEPDPCGIPGPTFAHLNKTAGAGWGYNYDSLRADLQKWKLSPHVTVDSIGVTVQGRTMYMMTIHNRSAAGASKKRVWIHARTHPIEVQGTRVTNEIIRLLLADTPYAAAVRDSCVFNIVPMYNIDGVELGAAGPPLQFDRQNANGIDIESNWNTTPAQPEVQVLKRMFTGLMAQTNPIRVAINMHSAYGKVRYFVYHKEAGTSPAFAALEQQFIAGVQNYFPGGIQPYTYFQSWNSAPAPQYPESWFWQNYREAVMALTYEDMNDPSAAMFDVTANAILRGVTDYLGVTRRTSAVRPLVAAASTTVLDQNYPNPFNPSTTIRFSVSRERPVELTVVDVLGRVVTTLVNRTMPPGTYEAAWDASELPSGMYIAVLRAGASADGEEKVFLSTRKLLLQK